MLCLKVKVKKKVKVKILNKERKSLYAEVAKIYGRNESAICETEKKQEIMLVLLLQLNCKSYRVSV